jgi:hypothetical protein
MIEQTAETGKPRGSLAALFAVLAFIACNGIILLIAVLSAIGISISISINPHLQAVAISLFALITLLLIFRDFRRHREHGPLILAAIATVALIGTMYIHYSKIVESIGMLLLLAAALWGWQINRKRCRPESAGHDDY